MRNPTAPQRDRTEANKFRTKKVIEVYYGKNDLLKTWEKFASDDLQIKEHDYLLELRKQVRQTRNYIEHRAGPDADL